MGQPIAFIGHKVQCPKCKGTFPIVEGILTTTIFGKGVAVAGMKTACGAVLIPTQFTDTVEWSSGGSANSVAATPTTQAAQATTASVGNAESAAQAIAGASSNQESPNLPFDEQYVLLDEHGAPMADLPYTVKLPSGVLEHGITDAEGRTMRYATASEQQLEVHLGHLEA